MMLITLETQCYDNFMNERVFNMTYAIKTAQTTIWRANV